MSQTGRLMSNFEACEIFYKEEVFEKHNSQERFSLNITRSLQVRILIMLKEVR